MTNWIVRANAILPEQHKPLLRDVGLLVLRLGAGSMMALSHGLPKLKKLLAGDTSFADPLGIGSVPSLVLASSAEFGASLLLCVGLLTRVACIPLAFTMCVAAFIVHADDPFSKQEFALLYLTAFVTLLLTGPGAFSIDAWLVRRSRTSR